MTKNVLIVYDRDGWAWSHMGAGLQKYAPAGYSVDIMASDKVKRHGADRDYDASLQMSWPESANHGLARRNSVLVASHGVEYSFPNENPDPAARIATRLRNREQASRILARFNGVLCVSERLTQLAAHFNDNAVFTSPGVDTDLFVPETPRVGEKLVVGWCGQRAGVTKGYEERLIPLMDQLDGKVEFAINDRGPDRPLTQAEMVEWFARIDVFISTSYSEGCQMPLMEAMASGKPVIATDAGCARLFVRNRWNGTLIDERDDKQVVARFVEEILRLDANPAHRLMQGGNARWLMDHEYSWRVRSGQWLKAICGETA